MTRLVVASDMVEKEGAAKRGCDEPRLHILHKHLDYITRDKAVAALQ